MTDTNLQVPGSLQPPTPPESALTTGVTGGVDPTMDPAQSVLTRAEGLDKQTQHDAWDMYHSAADEDELTQHLQNSSLPRQVKHDLWEAKHTESLVKGAADATSGANAAKEGQRHVKVQLPRYGNVVQNQSPEKNAQDLKTLGVTAGTVAAAPVAAALETGALGTAALTGAGAALGNSAGQAVAGQNPLTAEQAKESAKVGAMMGASDLMIGGISGLVGKVVKWFNPEIDAALPAGSSFHPALNNTPNEVVQHAADEGIKLTPAQATQSPVRQGVQSAGENALVGGDALKQGIQESADTLNNSVREFQRRLDPKMEGTTPESAGEAVKENVQKLKDAAHESASQAYKTLPPELQNLAVDTTEIQTEWGKAAGEMYTAMANMPPAVRGPLEQAFKMGQNLGTPIPGAPGMSVSPYLSFKDAAQLRSIAREMGDTRIAELPAQYQGLFKKLASDIDMAMETTAEKVGLVDEWRAANAGWKEYVKNFGEKASPFTRILSQTDPAKITNMIKSSSAKDIDMLNQLGIDLGPIKNQVIDDIAKRGWKVDRVGLGGYDDGTLNTLFGPAAKKELYLKSDLGRRLAINENPSGTAKLGAKMGQMVSPKLAGAMGTSAKASMPREAESFLPKPDNHVGEAATAAARVGTAKPRATVAEQLVGGNQQAQTQAPDSGLPPVADGSVRVQLPDGSIHDVHQDDFGKFQQQFPGGHVIH